MQVLNIAVNTQIFKMKALQERFLECVTESDVLDAQIRAVLDVTVADAVVVVRVVETRCRSLGLPVFHADIGDVVISVLTCGIYLVGIDGHELCAVTYRVELVGPGRLHACKVDAEIVHHVISIRTVKED